MHRRVNITLPEETIRLFDRVARKGDRSHLISEAVRRYVTSVGKARLRRLLKEGAIRLGGAVGAVGHAAPLLFTVTRAERQASTLPFITASDRVIRGFGRNISASASEYAV